MIRDEDTSRIKLLEELPSPDTLRIDQILTSKLFGLKSTIDPEAEALFDEYYKLLSVTEKERTQKQRKSIDQLQKKLKYANHLGDSLRDELFYLAIDQVIANTDKPEMRTAENLQPQVVESINTFLKSISFN